MTDESKSRRTDHSVYVKAMRENAQEYRNAASHFIATDLKQSLEKSALIMECAAGLLEVHDTTGISLDSWRGPRELVEWALAAMGGTLEENKA